MNMSSEIEFLRDQNLQILLRTNSQMWTILIRDLRLRIERDEQHRLAPPQAPVARNPGPQPVRASPELHGKPALLTAWLTDRCTLARNGEYLSQLSRPG